MRKLTFLLLSIGVIGMVYFKGVAEEKSTPVKITPTLTATPTYKTISIGNEVYAYEIMKVPSDRKVTLVANFDKKIKSQELIRENNCAMAVNGGFYDTNMRPLGLFISNGQLIGKEINSDLFNGFIWINRDDSRGIGYQKSEAATKDIIQTGPIVKSKGQLAKLALNRDKLSRRTVAAIDAEDNFIFISLFDKNVLVLGPRLESVPELLSEVETKENINIQDAINLDGGRASLFSNQDIYLPEIDMVGSVWCIHN
jgi:exopolysaccharide biosynthesis protein